ncbi:reverse transcriptase domain-containing protein [Tanacetum coccineum]
MLAPSGGGLILYQAYGNLYAMTGRKAHLLEDKQIPSVGVFDEVFLALRWHLEEIHVTWAHLENKRTRLRTYTKSMKNPTTTASVMQQTGIQCYNHKEFGHVARKCKKPKRARNLAYHKEKMLMCKQEEAGIQLSTEQVDWRDDTDDEPED